jgi:regulatory protein
LGKAAAYAFQKSAPILHLRLFSYPRVAYYHLSQHGFHPQPSIYGQNKEKSGLGYMKKRKQAVPFVFEEGKEKELQLKLETYCAYTERCPADVKAKLKEWKVPRELWDACIQELKDLRFLSEERYGEAFARGKFKLKSWGKSKIKAALEAKAVDANIISDAIKQIDDSDYRGKLVRILEKKNALLKEENAQKRREKLFRFAAQKGYETKLIFECMKEVLQG